MAKIKGILNKDNVHKYSVDLTPGLHINVMNLLKDLGFENVSGFDVDPYESGYFDCIVSDSVDVYLYVSDKILNIVIKTNMDQQKLVDIVMKHFQLFES
jgi:5'-3' exonuclease